MVNKTLSINGTVIGALLCLMALLLNPTGAWAAEYEYKVYFGLSKSTGAVSLAEWEHYEAGFAKQFPGFTVTPATGFYKGAKERSRVITLLMNDCLEPTLKAEVQRYVKTFAQHSVLMSKTKLVSAVLVTAESEEALPNSCPAK